MDNGLHRTVQCTTPTRPIRSYWQTNIVLAPVSVFFRMFQEQRLETIRYIHNSSFLPQLISKTNPSPSLPLASVSLPPTTITELLMNEHPVELLNRFSTVFLQIFMAPSKKYLCFAFSFFGFVVGSGIA